jgi:hypothetical protein
MSLAVRKKHHLAANDVKEIHPKKHSVIDVAQGDFAIMDNNKDAYLFLDTRGAGPCVGIAIRTADKTLLAHMDADTDDRGVGSRADKNLHEILEKMLDLVSEDHTKIESIGLLSTSGLRLGADGKPDYNEQAHADEVLKYLIDHGKLSDDCVIELGKDKNDLIVNLRSGDMHMMENQVRIQEYANVDHKGNIKGYPDDVEHSKILKLVPDPPKNEQKAAAPTLDDNNGNDVLGADNQDQEDSDAPPDIDDSNGDGGDDASNDAAASAGGDMGGGMDEMNNESEMMEE